MLPYSTSSFANAEGCFLTALLLSRMRKGVLRKKRRKPRRRFFLVNNPLLLCFFLASSPKKQSKASLLLMKKRTHEKQNRLLFLKQTKKQASKSCKERKRFLQPTLTSHRHQKQRPLKLPKGTKKSRASYRLA